MLIKTVLYEFKTRKWKLMIKSGLTLYTVRIFIFSLVVEGDFVLLRESFSLPLILILLVNIKWEEKKLIIIKKLITRSIAKAIFQCQKSRNFQLIYPSLLSFWISIISLINVFFWIQNSSMLFCCHVFGYFMSANCNVENAFVISRFLDL